MTLQILLFIISSIFIWRIMYATYVAFIVRVAAVILIVIAMRTFVLQ